MFVWRFVPSILHVRNTLLLEKGKKCDRVTPLVAHVAALVAVTILAAAGFASFLTVGIFAFLLARSVHGLSSSRVKMKAMQIGDLGGDLRNAHGDLHDSWFLHRDLNTGLPSFDRVTGRHSTARLLLPAIRRYNHL